MNGYRNVWTINVLTSQAFGYVLMYLVQVAQAGLEAQSRHADKSRVLAERQRTDALQAKEAAEVSRLQTEVGRGSTFCFQCPFPLADEPHQRV